MSVKVLIAVDHPLLRYGLTAYLEGQPDIRVVAQADDGDQVLPEIARARIEVILLDVKMPGMATGQILEALPHLESPPRVLIFTAYRDPDKVVALGIDLDPPGITPNDAGDVDSGPNNLQNFPLLTSVSRDGASTLVEGTLNSTPNTTYRLEFFANTACDPSGNGEGESYLGSQDVATDANGNASFSAMLPAGVSGGTPVSATATDPGGNTSEFSACRESISGAYNWHYQYDALYRLTGADYSDGTYFRYTYDAYFAEGKSGNRLSEETVTGTITYTYDSANRLASVDGAPYTWENVFAAGKPGNLLSDGVYTYTFNHANQLAGVRGAGSTVSYSYNGQGDRVSQTVGITTTTYTLDLAAGLTQVLSDGTDTYLYGNGRIAQSDASGAQYFLGDALGSVRQLVDANGEVLLAQSYEPYGEVLASVGEEESSYGFTGDQKLIALMTGIEPHVVAQYYDLVEKYRPEKLVKNQSLSRAQVRTNALIRVFAIPFEDGMRYPTSC